MNVASAYAGDISSFFHAYMYRPEREEVLRSPEFMLNDFLYLGYFEGDCDDASIMGAAMWSLAGFPVRFVAIRYSANAKGFEHVFVEVWRLGEWMAFDPTVAPGTVYQRLEEMIQYI